LKNDGTCEFLEEFMGLFSVEMDKLGFLLVSRATIAESCSLLQLNLQSRCSGFESVLERLEADGERLYAIVSGELVVYAWVSIDGVSSDSFSYHIELSVTHLGVLALYYRLRQQELDPFRIIWQPGVSDQYYPKDAWKDCYDSQADFFSGCFITRELWKEVGMRLIDVHVEFFRRQFMPAIRNNSTAEGLLLLKEEILTAGRHFCHNLGFGSSENSGQLVALSLDVLPDLTGRFDGLDIVLAYQAGRLDVAAVALDDLKMRKRYGLPGFKESDIYVDNVSRLLDGTFAD